MPTSVYSKSSSFGRRIPAVALVFILSIALFGLFLSILIEWPVAPVSAGPGTAPLGVEIIAGYNLVVDSNVGAASTYAPAVATVEGKFCNNSAQTLTLG